MKAVEAAGRDVTTDKVVAALRGIKPFEPDYYDDKKFVNNHACLKR